jgi:signal transduction histidine kinase
VPLAGASGAEGVVALAWTPGRRELFHDLDPALPTNFAEQAALALRIARSTRDKQRLGLYEERERIARDLHDVVIQRLFAVGLSLQGALRSQDAAKMTASIDRAVDDLDETIRDIRRTIFELGSPEQADDAQSEVTRICDRAASALKFRPRVSFEGPVRTRVEPSLVPHLVAVLSELLSNAARHASASSVSVVLSAKGSDVALRVADDGRGLPEHREESGLANLRDRARSRGGTVTVTPGEPSGTVVEWRVPVAAGRAAVPAPRGQSGGSGASQAYSGGTPGRGPGE